MLLADKQKKQETNHEIWKHNLRRSAEVKFEMNKI